jgi:hypothetical protein
MRQQRLLNGVIQQPLLAHKVNPFKALYNRIEMKQVEALVEASKESLAQLRLSPLLLTLQPGLPPVSSRCGCTAP